MPYFKWNDHQIFYRQQGEGPLLLILPGNTASSICHQGEADYFCNRFHVVSFDFLGTGQSDRIPTWPDDWWGQGASQARALVEHLGRQDCIVMGTSGGAAIALRMAIQYPRVVRAVIADSCIETFTNEMAEKNVIQERKDPSPEQIQFWQYAHGSDWEQVITADTAMVLRFVERGGDWFQGRLNEVQCPVLLTASREDSFLAPVFPNVSKMAEQIPNCRLFVNNRGGHPLMWTAPQDFRAVSDYFFKTIEA